MLWNTSIDKPIRIRPSQFFRGLSYECVDGRHVLGDDVRRHTKMSCRCEQKSRWFRPIKSGQTKRQDLVRSPLLPSRGSNDADCCLFICQANTRLDLPDPKQTLRPRETAPRFQHEPPKMPAWRDLPGVARITVCGSYLWDPPSPRLLPVDMDWHPQTPPSPHVLTPDTPEYYASQIPGAFPENNVVLSSHVVSGRKRKRAEYEEDDEESLNSNRLKRVCCGIYSFIGGFFIGLDKGTKAIQGDRPYVTRRLGGSIQDGTAAACHLAYTFVINSSYTIVRIVRERRRNARRAHRARNPLPELRQSPFHRAIIARDGLLSHEEPATPGQFSSDPSHGKATETNSRASSPEIVDSEYITVSAGPICRILFNSAKKCDISSRPGPPNPFQNMPRFTPPREPSPKRVMTPVQTKMRSLPPCKPLEGLFPQIDRLGIEIPQLPTPPDSPTTQLMQELDQSIRDESDSDISSTVDNCWIPPPPKRTLITSNTIDEKTLTTPRSTEEPTAAQPLIGENTEGSSRPIIPEPCSYDINTVRTPASRRVRFKTRSYVETPETEISSTCDASPGPTPYLEIPTADRLQIEAQSRADQKESDLPSTIPATTGPIPKRETPKFETPITRSASAKGKAPETNDSEISSTCDATPGPTPQLPPLSQLEQDIASHLHITPAPPITPKSNRHSSEKVGRFTRARKRAQDLLDDSKKYTLAPLSTEQQLKVQEAVRKGHGKLSATDLRRVVTPEGARGTEAWLNDETINAYLELVVAFGKRNDRKGQETPSHHAFNSFFYENLSKKGPEAIKRWAKRAKIDGKKLLETKYVFIPINSGMHWTLAVVSGQQKTITHYNSLPGLGNRHLRLVEDWVKSELGSAWNGDEWELVNGESPQQMNSDDCGVFTVTNARQLMLGMGGHFAAAQIPLQRQRMVVELVEGELVKGEE